MSLWRQLTRGGRRLIAGRSADRDLDEEIQNYLDEASAALEEDGHTPEDAERIVRATAGSVIAIRETVRASGWEHAVETSIADLRYAMRRLWHAPGFAFVAIGTLAVGIGAALSSVARSQCGFQGG